MISKEKMLNAMGIQNWSLRVSLPLQSQPQSGSVVAEAPAAAPDKSVFCYYYQWEKDGAVIANMLAQYGSGNLEESNLVAAIAKALPWSSKGKCETLSPAQALKISGPLVVLGEGLSAELGLQAGELVWVSHAPSAMLTDPSLKRAAWGQLQELKSILV